MLSVYTIKFCEEFFNENISDQEKESFIKSNTEIYFLAIDLTPLQWLKKVITEIKEAIYYISND